MASWDLHDGEEQAGPFDEDHVVRMIQHGIPATTLVRQLGTEDWKGLRSHPPFALALAAVEGGAVRPNVAPPQRLLSRRRSAAFWLVGAGLLVASTFVLAIAWPKRTPESICAHETVVSPLVAKSVCLTQLTELGTLDPQILDDYGKCSLDAKNHPTLAECKKMLDEYSTEQPQNAIGAMIRALEDAHNGRGVLCPSAKPVPRSIDQVKERYSPTDDDWSDLGWKCAHWRDMDPTRWQYEVVVNGHVATAYARKRLRSGKVVELNRVGLVEGGKFMRGRRNRPRVLSP